MSDARKLYLPFYHAILANSYFSWSHHLFQAFESCLQAMTTRSGKTYDDWTAAEMRRGVSNKLSANRDQHIDTCWRFK
jgi:hypothetical protein